jgi:hypothetical protein
METKRDLNSNRLQLENIKKEILIIHNNKSIPQNFNEKYFSDVA